MCGATSFCYGGKVLTWIFIGNVATKKTFFFLFLFAKIHYPILICRRTIYPIFSINCLSDTKVHEGSRLRIVEREFSIWQPLNWINVGILLGHHNSNFQTFQNMATVKFCLASELSVSWVCFKFSKISNMATVKIFWLQSWGSKTVIVLRGQWVFSPGAIFLIFKIWQPLNWIGNFQKF